MLFEDKEMDEAYTGFAFVYDLFMDETPYEKWGAFLEKSLIEYGITQGIVLELGCGTGIMTEYLAKKGYDMIGVDNSYDMLDVASKKQAQRIAQRVTADGAKEDLVKIVRAD